MDSWVELSRDLADRYHVHFDGRYPRRQVRYVAVARSLDVRPYAIVTADPDELRLELGRGSSAGGRE